MASKEVPLLVGDAVTWTGVKGKSYSGTLLRESASTLAVLTDTTQNVMSFSKQAARAAGLRKAK